MIVQGLGLVGAVPPEMGESSAGQRRWGPAAASVPRQLVYVKCGVPASPVGADWVSQPRDRSGEAVPSPCASPFAAQGPHRSFPAALAPRSGIPALAASLRPPTAPAPHAPRFSARVEFYSSALGLTLQAPVNLPPVLLRCRFWHTGLHRVRDSSHISSQLPVVVCRPQAQQQAQGSALL